MDLEEIWQVMREIRPEIESSLDTEDYLSQVICIVGFTILAIVALPGVISKKINPGIQVLCIIALFVASAMNWSLFAIFLVPALMLFRKVYIPPNLLIVFVFSMIIGTMAYQSKWMQADVLCLLLTHIFPAFLVLNQLRQYFQNYQSRNRTTIEIGLLSLFVCYLLGMNYFTERGHIVHENLVGKFWKRNRLFSFPAWLIGALYLLNWEIKPWDNS